MKKPLLSPLLAVALSSPALAETDAELLAEVRAMKARLAQLETRVGQLQQENQQLKADQAVQAEKVAAVETVQQSSPAPAGESAAEKIADTVELSGTVEIGAYAGEGYEGDDYSDLTVDTAAVALTAQLNDYSSAEISLLYEEDDTDLEVDTASVTFATENSPWSLQLGQTYLPFGAYSTSLVNDTLPLEIAETRETAAIAGYSEHGITALAYVFNGDVDHDSASNDTLQNWGARLAYDSTADNAGFGIGVDYLSNIADSDSIGDYLDDNWTSPTGAGYDQWLRSSVSAWAVHGYANAGPVLLTAELVRTDGFSSTEMNSAALAAAPVGEEPLAWQLEAAYTTELFDREYTFAFAWQETEDALFLELPERRQSLGASTALDDKTTLGLELWRDKDYSTANGGTGERSHNIGLLLTREF